MKVPASSASTAVAAARPAAAAAAANGAAKITGSVKLVPALAANAAPTDTVFVFARAAQGPRMPLAIVRKQVKDLPFSFTLDDSMAMNPSMKLSSFPQVVVGARISKSGNAMPQSGDLQGQSEVVAVGAGQAVDVVINSVTP
jgi:cytochrome c-type biogenesis protein CcmH